MVAGLLIVAFVGAPLGGHFTDQMLKTRANARMLFPAICASAATVILAVGLSFFKGSVLYVFIAASAFFTMMCLPGTLAVTQDLVHPGLRTSSRSVTVIYQTLLGGALGPLVVGALSDAFGLDKAFLILPAVYALSAALFFWGSLFCACI